MIEFICVNCGKVSYRLAGDVNKARKKGASLYCGRVCAGVGRRSDKTRAEKKEEKRLYDISYRLKNREAIKKRKKEYFKKTYDKEKAAQERARNMPRHLEYCRSPKYKAWKKRYDEEYRAKNNYGEFWESSLALLQIEKEVSSRMDWTEIRTINKVLNKKQTRRRDYERFNSN